MAATAKPDATALAELKRSFAGELVTPDDAAYDQHRAVWNGSIDRSPALIARCAVADDVPGALRLVRQTGLPLAVRGGGHSFPGASVCDDGVVIDFSLMRGIEPDPEAGTVRVEPGVLLGELDAATRPLAMAVPAGIVTHTGVAGLTLGGGIGWLQRRYGLTADQLLAAEVVTADGDLLRASADQNADLFWGLRGGGGNLGIVTSFEFRLNPLDPTVLAGPIFWRMEDSGDVLRFYRDWIADAPDELMTIVVHRKAPAVDWLPSELHGELVVAVACCWCGEIERGEKVIRPLREFGSPLIDLCAPKPFVEHQAMFDPSFPHGRWYYMRSCDVDELSDEVVEITVERSMRIESPLTSFPIWQQGGAISRVGEEETAFTGRGAGHTFNITCSTEGLEGFDRERQWAREFWSALEPFHTSVYVNFLMDEGLERVREAYGPVKFDRLRELKRRYDPDNLLGGNLNVPPG